jgi:hypothetical protein
MPSIAQLKVDLEVALDDMASTLAAMRREQSQPDFLNVSANAVAEYERARVRWLLAMEALRTCGEPLVIASAELPVPSC